MSARCELTDLLVDQCAHCTGATSVEEQADAERRAVRARLLAERSDWFLARFAGRCYRCGERFSENVAIRRHHIDDVYSAYVAECCAEVTS